MTVTVSPVALFNAERQEFEDAELWDGITEKQLTDWEGEWLPELFKAVQKLKRVGVAREFWPQSRHWDWRKKTQTLQGMLAYPGFSVVCDGLTQGMMIVDLATKRCRIESQKGMPIIYVDYIENAPWNRKELLYDPPKYRGVGSMLITAAIELSKQEEFKGRIGLHSLPQANNFYANTCGMTDLGTDHDCQGLRYFEMTSVQAEAFIKRGGQP